MNMKQLLILVLLAASIVSCQQPPNNNSDTAVKTDAAKGVGDNGPLGPVEDASRLKFPPGYQLMDNPERLLGGAWVSQCYSQTVLPHIPFISRMQFYRLFYYFDHVNMTVGHVAREYNDPMCEEEFGGEINLAANDTMVIKGRYQVTRIDPMFPNIMKIAFNWMRCSGGGCQIPQNTLNDVYLFEVRATAFRQSVDGRQVMFWGANVPPRPGSPTPFLPEQIFDWNRPFFRVNFSNQLVR